ATASPGSATGWPHLRIWASPKPTCTRSAATSAPSSRPSRPFSSATVGRVWRNDKGGQCVRTWTQKFHEKGTAMSRGEGRGIGHWLIMALAALLVLAALPLIVGGAYLIALGGSWYYLPAGLALLATAIVLFRRSRLAVWI